MHVVHHRLTITTGDGPYSPGLNKADSQTLIRTLGSLAFRVAGRVPLACTSVYSLGGRSTVRVTYGDRIGKLDESSQASHWSSSASAVGAGMEEDPSDGADPSISIIGRVHHVRASEYAPAPGTPSPYFTYFTEVFLTLV